MKNSRFPVEQLTRKLAVHATFHNPSLFIERNVDDSAKMFEMELALHQKLGTLDLPPNTVKYMKATSRGKKTQQLVCDGFTLWNRSV